MRILNGELRKGNIVLITENSLDYQNNGGPKYVQQGALYKQVIFGGTLIDKHSIHPLLFGIVYSL